MFLYGSQLNFALLTCVFLTQLPARRCILICSMVVIFIFVEKLERPCVELWNIFQFGKSWIELILVIVKGRASLSFVCFSVALYFS